MWVKWNTYVHYFKELINVSFVATYILSVTNIQDRHVHSKWNSYEYDATQLVAISYSMRIARLTAMPLAICM